MESEFYDKMKRITEEILFDRNTVVISTIKKRIEEEAEKGHGCLTIELNTNDNISFIMDYFIKENFAVSECDNIEHNPSKKVKIAIGWPY